MRDIYLYVFQPALEETRYHPALQPAVISKTANRVDPKTIDCIVQITASSDFLLGNAIKFSRRATVDITMITADRALELRVSDQGPGIPADEIDRLFMPFAQTSAKSPRGQPNKGTGLGLYIAKIIVEGHNGTIEVISEVGKGTMFIVGLPLDRPDPTRPDSA